MARIVTIGATKLDLTKALGYEGDTAEPLYVAVRNGLFNREVPEYRRLEAATNAPFVAPTPPADDAPAEDWTAYQAQRDAAREQWDKDTDAAFYALLALISADTNITEGEDGEPLPKATDPAFWAVMPDDVRFACYDWYRNYRYQHLRERRDFLTPSASR